MAWVEGMHPGTAPAAPGGACAARGPDLRSAHISAERTAWHTTHPLRPALQRVGRHVWAARNAAPPYRRSSKATQRRHPDSSLRFFDTARQESLAPPWLSDFSLAAGESLAY